MEKSSLHRTDYQTLLELARARNIKVVEARGLDTRKGVRFRRDGVDWIALDSDLAACEKTRTLGYLLRSEPKSVASKVGIKGDFSSGSGLSPVLTLCCPTR